MHLPQTVSMAALNGEITRQASAIAFLNDFWMMMIMTVAAIPLLLLLRPVRQAAAPAIVADH
jgi:DHA2 family multidrug resistance protein